eukprot:CAMPEP_0182804526 /NCGR_PEP_ID=MMETSP0006_2-20121128/4593_1 /TAXON_ID=97485 /ORGANISM="Prymnesium parvum, Strain Texoma1" /LENGTH=307 /DNA_ID=CAMNT_0024930041 /DNA_START=120 /DNA_END=1043 /DNA_ORIENTATION=+
MSAFLRSCLLGVRVPLPAIRVSLPATWDAPGLRPLNSSQADAVKHALTHPLTLVQGPPGTGKKLETAASLVYHFVNQGRGPVLVCAASNAAGDHLAEKILLTGVSVVRLYSRSHRVSTISRALTLEAHLVTSTPFRPTALLQLQSTVHSSCLELSPTSFRSSTQSNWNRRGKVQRRGCAPEADVVVCTCSAAAESRLASRTFHFLLIDEAAQALEPEAVIPFTNGIQQAVLVGDHKQLGSIVPTRQLQAAGVARQRGGGRPRTCAVRTCSVSREGPGTRRGEDAAEGSQAGGTDTGAGVGVAVGQVV